MNTATVPGAAKENPAPEGKDKNDDVGDVCYRWWRQALGPETGRGRAARARLRKAASAVEAIQVEETFELYKALDRKPDTETLALIAISLAQIKENTAQKAAERFGRKNGDTRLLSDLRFQRLVRTPDPAELVTPLRRALKVIDDRANICDLARDLYYWNEETRIRWCFEYYGGGPVPTNETHPAPEHTETDKTKANKEETAS